MTNNEKSLVESVVNHNTNIIKVQEGLKNKFGYESTYDSESNVLTIIPNGMLNEGLSMVAAKQYVYDKMTENGVIVAF